MEKLKHYVILFGPWDQDCEIRFLGEYDDVNEALDQYDGERGKYLEWFCDEHQLAEIANVFAPVVPKSASPITTVYEGEINSDIDRGEIFINWDSLKYDKEAYRQEDVQNLIDLVEEELEIRRKIRPDLVTETKMILTLLHEELERRK